MQNKTVSVGGDVAMAHDEEMVHPASAASAVEAWCTMLGARGGMAAVKHLCVSEY